MKTRILLAIAVILSVGSPLWADKWATPTPRVFASRWGNHAFKLLRPRFDGPSKGVLFHLDSDGQEQIVWQAELVNTPHQVIVDDRGEYVATVDTYGRLGYDHSLVIYGGQGSVIGDFQLEDLFTAEEITNHAVHSVSSRFWADEAEFNFDGGHLVLTTHWGQTVRVELATGQIVAAKESLNSAARTPGLIGTASVNGDPARIAYHYPHGQVFPPELIRGQFHHVDASGDVDRPSVRIELVGYVELAEDTAVDIYHAAGGVNQDHGTLFIDNRQIGQVGDDTAKAVVYTLTLPKGNHEVRWLLTGGTFQTNLLRLQDTRSGALLDLFHTRQQRDQTGASRATKTIEAQGEVDGWPLPLSAWTRVATD